jgi:transcriptional regulator with XRE-family HTH domain
MSTSASGADLGRAVRRLRRAQRLTIEDIAFAADVHPTYLSSIERGERNPSWKKLCGLADALGVSVPALVEKAEEEAVVARIAKAARERLRTRASGRLEYANELASRRANLARDAQDRDVCQ